MKPNPAFGRNQIRFISCLSYLSWFPACSFDKRGTTKEAKDTKTLRRKVHPQISQISTDDFNAEVFSICENLRNLWINPFVEKHLGQKNESFESCTQLRQATIFLPL